MYKPELPRDIDHLQWIGPDDKICAESGLVHCARIPPEATRAQPAPMVVMLHGWGGDESAMWIFKQSLPLGVAAITPRAPVARNDSGFVWFEETNLRPKSGSLSEALNKLEQFLDRLPSHYPVDPTRLVLIGFSQGAFMGNTFALTHPYDIIGVASLAGAIPSLPDNEQHDGLLAGLPVFIAHGTRDDTIPLSAAQHTRDLYRRLGADVTYGEYPVAHKMNPRGMKDLRSWLAKLLPQGC